MPIKTSSGKWKWGNVERDSKKELVQTVYGIWKKNGSKGSFSDFLKGTHESLDESLKTFNGMFVSGKGTDTDPWLFEDKDGRFSFEAFPWIEDENALYVQNLKVLKKHRGKGYGNIMLDTIEKWGKEKGFKKLYWDAEKRTLAYNWYIRHGFKEVKPYYGLKNFVWIEKKLKATCESLEKEKERYFVTDLNYGKHIKPVLDILKKWKRMQIGNITKHADNKSMKWFGIYKGSSIEDIVALAAVNIDKADKEIFFNQINSGEKGMGKFLIDKMIEYFKKNRNGCDHISWFSDPDSGEPLKDFYRKNFPDAKETEEKNEWWQTSKFTLKLKESIIAEEGDIEKIDETVLNASKKDWYHGTNLPPKELKVNPPSCSKLFWVTTEKEYAEKFKSEYKNIKFGSIYKILLKDRINVFDPKNNSEVEQLKWPKYFKFWLKFKDDILKACSEVISKDDWDKKYKDFIKGASHTEIENRLEKYIHWTKISNKEAEKDISEWDDFLNTKLGYDKFIPSKFKNYYAHDNRPDGFVRTKLCEELKKLGYQAIKSKEYGYDTLGIFDIDALDKISYMPLKLATTKDCCHSR